MFLGSGICQSMNCLAGIQGQASPHPMVTTASNGANSLTSSSDLLSWVDRSYPNFLIAATAFGFTTPEGFDPALYADTSSPPWIFAKAWAIWLRLLFSIQTNKIFFFMTGKIK